MALLLRALSREYMPHHQSKPSLADRTQQERDDAINKKSHFIALDK